METDRPHGHNDRTLYNFDIRTALDQTELKCSVCSDCSVLAAYTP